MVNKNEQRHFLKKEESFKTREKTSIFIYYFSVNKWKFIERESLMKSLKTVMVNVVASSFEKAMDIRHAFSSECPNINGVRVTIDFEFSNTLSDREIMGEVDNKGNLIKQIDPKARVHFMDVMKPIEFDLY